MSKVELMSAEREIELIREMNREAGSYEKYKKALDELVLSNLGLVHKIVHKFPIKNASCSYEDLYHAGIEGLIHGIEKFDCTRGYRLSTYVYRWVQAYVSRYYQNHGRTIRVPVHMSDKQMKLKKQIEDLTKQLGRTPDSTEITSINQDAWTIQNLTTANVSLNQMISEDDDLECLQGEDKTDEFETNIDCDILLSRIRESVSDRDYQILIQRYGLQGEDPHTLSEIAEKHDITRARCHQIQNGIIKRLKAIAVA